MMNDSATTSYVYIIILISRKTLYINQRQETILVAFSTKIKINNQGVKRISWNERQVYVLSLYFFQVRFIILNV
jgi:hypothetical protein